MSKVPELVKHWLDCDTLWEYGYGPPDPPPSMEYDTRATYLAMESEEEVLA